MTIPVFELEGCRWIVVDEVGACGNIANNGESYENRESDGGVQTWQFAFRIEARSAGRIEEAGYRHRFKRSA
jgi:hypothetical protein